jgi:16S rRNA (cytosine1402-N4)-methyltransferase
MPSEVLDFLRPVPGGVYLDGTLGGAGHAVLVLEVSSPDGRLVGLDRDPETLRRAETVLAPFGDRVTLRHRNFSEAPEVVAELGIGLLDGVLLDLGVSSFQLDEASRGFSFRSDAPLDMRMDRTGGTTAAEVVNNLDAAELARIFREFGEERWAGRIARRIVGARSLVPLDTTRQLADLVREAVPGGRAPARIHPATRVFQALRIYVNRELEHVALGVSGAIDLLKPEGRLVVISFHSLEDRIVQRIFQEKARGCVCPPRQGVRPGTEEVEANPRARSAILRAVSRLS